MQDTSSSRILKLFIGSTSLCLPKKDTLNLLFITSGDVPVGPAVRWWYWMELAIRHVFLNLRLF